jgi:hypothetical protein
MMNDPSLSTPELLSRARDNLATLETDRKQVAIGHRSIDAHKLLEAMLTGAKYSDGERYTAAAIVKAHGLTEPSEAGQHLSNLAREWLLFLLLSCA